MGKVMVRASAIGPNGTRLFDFLVDTGSTFVGLPMSDIEALGLPMVHDGRHETRTATGVVELDAYVCGIRIEDGTTPAFVSEAPIPLLGYEVLEKLRWKVNPVTQDIEKVPDDEVTPPYVRRFA